MDALANASMSTEVTSDHDANEIFKQLETYPWDTDKEFQGGLAAILGPKPSTDPSQILELTLRAQCFYFSRKKSTTIDFSAYKEYLSTRSQTSFSQPPSATAKTAPLPFETSIQLPPPSNGDATTPSTSSSLPNAPPQPPPHPANFQEIIALIQSGAPIPGIMDIPDTVLTGQSSTPSLPKRKKPWEKDLPSTTEGTFGDRRDEYIVQELPEEIPATNVEDTLEGVAAEKV